MVKRNILITGGTRGIGRAITESLANEHHLLIGGRDAKAVEERCRSYPSAEPFVADLVNAKETEAAVARVADIDAVIHCAGMLFRGRSDSFQRKEWEEAFALNVTAAAELTRMLLPQLRATQGDIIFLNSGSGLYTYPEGSIYCASKHALSAYSDVLRAEERANGVRVTSIHPGHVATEMQQELRQKTNQPFEPHLYIQPQTIASAVKLALGAPPEAMFESIVVRPRWPMHS